MDFVSLGTVPAACPEPFGGLGLLTGGDAVVSDAGSRPGLGCGDKNHVHAGSFFCEQKKLVKGLKEDSVTASGDFSGFDDVALDVRSGPNGEHPTASVAFTFLGVRFEAASITCIAVRGGAATIGGTVKPNALGITAGVIQLSDNSGFGVPDGFAVTTTGSPPTTCPPPTPFSTTGATGDVVVRDAGFKPKP